MNYRLKTRLSPERSIEYRSSQLDSTFIFINFAGVDDSNMEKSLDSTILVAS